MKRYQVDKIRRLLEKVQGNDTLTVKKDEDPVIYFNVVKSYFESPLSSGFVRVEALGSACSNAVAVTELLCASGITQKKKIKTKSKLIPYEDQNGLNSRATMLCKIDLVCAPDFQPNQASDQQSWPQQQQVQERFTDRHKAPGYVKSTNVGKPVSYPYEMSHTQRQPHPKKPVASDKPNHFSRQH